MPTVRLESCSLEIDGRSLLAARPKPRVDVQSARIRVPLALVASAVRSQLPGFSLAIPDDTQLPRVEFAGEFEADEVMPDWMKKLLPDKWHGKLSVDGILEMKTTPSGRIQVAVMEAAVAGMHVPKALNIQRWVLEKVRSHIHGSSLLRKGTGDALFEIDVPAVAQRAGITLELPKKSVVSVDGQDVVLTFGAIASAPSATTKLPATPPARAAALTSDAPKRKVAARRAPARRAPARKKATARKAVARKKR